MGNGKFCRETEEFLANMIQRDKFRPLDVSYTIIDEQGVSIYSCSPAAAAEFPGMDPNLISAGMESRLLSFRLNYIVFFLFSFACKTATRPYSRIGQS